MSQALQDAILANLLNIDVYEKDQWETDSSRSTINGLGSLLGKGIMAVGIAVLRGIDYVSTRIALSRIAREQNRSGMRTESYQDMLEYQRYVSLPLRDGLCLTRQNISDQDFTLVRLTC